MSDKTCLHVLVPRPIQGIDPRPAQLWPKLLKQGRVSRQLDSYNAVESQELWPELIRQLNDP